MILLTVYFLPLSVNAQTAGTNKVTDVMINQVNTSNLDSIPSGSSIEAVIGNVIQALLSIFGIVFLGLMVYGGFVWLKAQGRDDEVSRAKDIIRGAIIGLAIVLSAYAISYFVVNNLVAVTNING